MSMNLRMGIAVIGSENLDKDSINNIFKITRTKIGQSNVEKVVFEKPIMNSSISKEAGRFFSNNKIDTLLIVEGSWAFDNFVIDIAVAVDCPIIFWVPQDPLNTPFPRVGSLVGALQNSGVLTKLGKSVEVILDDLDSDEGLKKLTVILKVLHLIKKLKFANIGLIGSRCPGMLDTSFHELELRNQIGPEVIHISITELIKMIKSIDKKEVDKELKQYEHIRKNLKTDNQTMMDSFSIYLATRRLVENYNLSALAFKCWPELKELNVCSPCFALSELTSQGIPSACEADVTSAVSMYILSNLSDKDAYLSDLLRINKDNNEAMYFHCGASSINLSKDGKAEYAEHADKDNVWKPGMTVEFPLKEGEVTFARIGEIKGKYRMISYSGKACETDMFVRGNPAKVILNKDPEYIIKELIKNGSEHHQIAVHGNIIDELKLFCDYLNLELIII